MNDYSQKSGNKILIFLLILLFTVMGFAAGYFLSVYESYKQSPVSYIKKEVINRSDNNEISSEIDFNLFWQVWDTVQDNYIEQPVNEEEMFYGALAGITASLGDPYSVYLNPELTQSFNDDINGTFEGIGAEIGVRDNRIVIIAPLPDTPAEQAGLKAGDVVLAIDGLDTTSMSLDYAVKLIRGEKDTQVKLIVSREDEDNQEIVITRNTIKVDSVRWEIKEQNNKKIGYIKIINFNTDTSNKFNQAITEILLKQPDGIILDLRNNPGGLLDESIQVASRFIKDDVIAYEEFQDGNQKEYEATGNALLENIPAVVLINQGSASASEIVAGALQDYEVATLLGEKTFGKGSVQDLKEFSDGSSLKLTVAKWLTPNKRSINEEGISPDQEVEMTKEDYENDTDPQLDKALEILTQ